MTGAGGLYSVIDATWPAHRVWQDCGWIFRDGRGGGKRVSAATLIGTERRPDVGYAVAQLAAVGQPPLFMLRPDQAAFDRHLAELGYAVLDPVTILQADIAMLDWGPPVHRSALSGTPTEAMAAVWAAGGIGPARLDVMRRCTLPKTCIGIAVDGETVATAYAACAASTAMCHAVEVLAAHRRRGLGRDIMRAALGWARNRGAARLTIITTDENAPALALYRGLGLRDIGHYHYRVGPAR